MGNRPVDWAPISEKDPTPGDPYEVREEARRLENIADTIKEQARLLRQAGQNQNLKGQYAVKLKEGADDLAGKLSKVEGRYTTVSGLLRDWARELEHAQEESRRALTQAKVDEKDEDRVDEAKSRMDDAVSHYETHGNRIANQIEDALDDDIEDSIWDDAVGWVKDHAEGFKLFLDILSWIGTALAIVAMFIPGVNLLVIAGIALGAAVVAGRMMLVAAGKATWMDVALDAAGLLTMGIGKGAMAGLKVAGRSAKAAATTSRVAGLKEGLAATKGMRNQLQRALVNAGDDATKAAVRQEMNTLRKLISRDAGKVADGGADIGALGKILNQGDDEAIGVLQNIRANAAAHGDAVSGGAVAGGHAAYAGAAAAQWTGFTVDVGDKALGDNDTLNAIGENTGGWKKDSWDGYNDFKSDTWKAPVSTAW